MQRMTADFQQRLAREMEAQEAQRRQVDSIAVPLFTNRMPQKHIQKLVDICGRANLSRNSLFGHLFIDL